MLGDGIRIRARSNGASRMQAARETLRQIITTKSIVQLAANLRGEERASFERPYGLAWVLQLVAELKEWVDRQAKETAANLRPLEETAQRRLSD